MLSVKGKITNLNPTCTNTAIPPLVLSVAQEEDIVASGIENARRKNRVGPSHNSTKIVAAGIAGTVSATSAPSCMREKTRRRRVALPPLLMTKRLLLLLFKVEYGAGRCPRTPGPVPQG